MLIADLSGAEWVLIIGAVSLGLGQLFTMVLTYLATKATKSGAQDVTRAVINTGEKAAVKVEEVKDKLEVSTENTDKKLNQIHTLVNSQMGEQKRLLAVALRDKANRSSDKRDIQAAEDAEQSHRDHESKQKAVDITIALQTTDPKKEGAK